MKVFSPKYYLNKYKTLQFEKQNPDKPWLNRYAINIFENILLDTDTMLECGSGRSTQWFSKKVKKLISIESEKDWYAIVIKQLESNSCNNVDYRLVDYSYNGSQENNGYLQTINELDENSLDIALVDGGPRSYCAMHLIPKLKSGGIIAIDDTQFYFPNDYKIPFSVRKAEDIPTLWNNSTKLVYKDLWDLIKNWRHFSVEDGIKVTTFIIKP
jgi:hypothetical protein